MDPKWEKAMRMARRVPRAKYKDAAIKRLLAFCKELLTPTPPKRSQASPQQLALVTGRAEAGRRA